MMPWSKESDAAAAAAAGCSAGCGVAWLVLGADSPPPASTDTSGSSVLSMPPPASTDTNGTDNVGVVVGVKGKPGRPQCHLQPDLPRQNSED